MLGKTIKLFALMTLAVTPANAEVFKVLDWAKYPAPLYKGPVAKPNFTGKTKWLPTQRVIRAAFRSGADFAGHYRLIPIGCGADCVNYVMGDMKTGQLYDFPIGGEGYYGLELSYYEGSRAVSAMWTDSVENRACFMQDYIFEGSRFIKFGTVFPTGHPCAVTGDGRGND